MSVAVGNGRHRGELKPTKGGSRGGGRDSSRSTKVKLEKSDSPVRDLQTDNSKATDLLKSKSKPRKYKPKIEVPLQKFAELEIAAVGPLVSDPASLGFVNRIHRPRPIPKYMLSQPRLLKTPKFVQNEWDRDNQLAMRQLEAELAGSDYQGLYEKLQVMREVERSEMERLGLVDAENATKTLNDAIVFSGTCCEMCPVFERVRRALENNVMALERDPQTNRISPSRAVKAFSRPAAGQAPPMPSEVRPPHVLVQTLDYLVDEILPKLPQAHSFLWDRTRSIRQDFTYQNFYGPEAIDCNERIVRVHLLSLHVMAGSDMEYLQQQELEQFNKALQTLLEIYEDVRHHGGQCPNEAEFRAYHLVSHFRDPEILHDLQRLPRSVFVDSRLQLAIRLVALCSQNNLSGRGQTNSPGALNFYAEFFRTVYSAECPFLMSCILETHFNEIRFYALKSMARCFHTRGKPYPNTLLQSVLGFSLHDDSLKFALYYEVDVIHDQGALFVDLFNKDKLTAKYKLNLVSDKPRFSQPYSTQLDEKIKGLSYRDIVNSGAVNGPLNFGSPQLLDLKSEANGIISAKPIGLAPLLAETPSISNMANGLGQATSKPKVAFGLDVPSSSRTVNLTSSISSQSKPIFNAFNTLISQKEQSSSNTAVPSNQSAAPNLSGSSLRFPVIPQPSEGTFGNAPTNLNSSDKLPAIRKEPLLISFHPQGYLSDLSNSKDSASSSLKSTKPPQLGLSFAFTKPFNADQTGLIFQPGSQGASTSKIASALLEPATKPLEQVIPATTPTISIPRQRMLVDHPHFNEAALQVYQGILEATVRSEIAKSLPKLMESAERRAARSRGIESLANDLYHAFISEASHAQVMDSTADSYRARITEQKYTRILAKVGKLCVEKAKQKQLKLAELGEFAVPSATTHETEKNTGLWAPLDIEKFAATCLRQIFSPKTLRILLVVQDWSRPVSRWLNTKLGLNLSKDRNRYQRVVRRGQLTLELESWGGESVRESFGNAAFVVVECGVTQDSDTTKVGETLERDRRVLTKIIQLLERYGRYHSQIMVIYWDINGSERSLEDIAKALGIDECRSSPNVEDIQLLDMSKGDALESLESGFSAMSAGFTLALSKRGYRASQSLERKALIKNYENQKSCTKESNTKMIAETNRNLENGADSTPPNPNAKDASSVPVKKGNSATPSNTTSENATIFATSQRSTPEPKPNAHKRTISNSSQLPFQSPAKRTKLYLYLQQYQSNRRIGTRDRNLPVRSPGTTRWEYTNNMTTMNASVLAAYGQGITRGSTALRDTSATPLPQQEKELHDMAQAIKAKYAGL